MLLVAGVERELAKNAAVFILAAAAGQKFRKTTCDQPTLQHGTVGMHGCGELKDYMQYSAGRLIPKRLIPKGNFVEWANTY